MRAASHTQADTSRREAVAFLRGGRQLLRAAAGLALALPLAAADLKLAQQDLLSGRYLDALAAAEVGVKGDEGQEQWHLVRLTGLMTIGNYPQAGAALSNALAAVPRSIRLRWLGRDVLRFNGQSEAANQAVKEIVDLVSARSWAYREAADLVTFGRAALALGADPKQVLDRVFAAAKRADPASRDVFLASGELALEKGDFALAARTFQEGLKLLPEDADLHWGLARAYAPSDTEAMLAAVQHALKHNSNHLGSLLLLTDQRVDEENFAEAEKLLERIRAINPWHPEAWAYAAVVAHLREQPARERAAREMALRFWTNNPHVDFRIGEKLSRNYRFAEGAAAQRRALAFDPAFVPAGAQLGQDLLRLGQDEEGWRLVAEVQQRDGYDVTANNLMKLRDVMDRFTAVTNEHFVVRMSAKEAPLYGDRVLALLERARERITRRYGVTLERPVLVEIFPEQKDFAVRTFGLPGYHGYLGVCFGHVITANSPAARPGSNFNWESMLWHEFVHVVTLQMTRNKMPRWLSEGISVFEERQANAAWGEQMKPRYREMILEGEMHPVGELSAAFMSPPSAEHLQFAYYQSSLVVEFIVEQFGQDRLVAILRDLGDGVFINDALAHHTAPLPTLEKEFAAFARQIARTWAAGLDWEKPPLAALMPGAPAGLWEAWAASRPTNYHVLTRTVREAIAAERWEEARAALETLIRAHPTAVGGDSPYRQLAVVHRALGRADGEREALARLAQLDDEAVDAYLRLMELGRDRRDWPVVLENAQRYLAVNPLLPAPYRFLAAAGEALGDAATAIGAYRALLQLDPANPAEVHFGLARQLHRAGDPAARRHVLQALEEAPRHRDALRLLLELHASSTDAPLGDAGESGGAP